MYKEMFEYVKDFLVKNNGEFVEIGNFPFRRRSEHMMRVYHWVKRLTEGYEDGSIRKHALFIAALFHDVGYGFSSKDIDHGANGAKVFREYATRNHYEEELTEFVAYLIEKHACKELMTKESTPIELILLMEADQLDETGALSIVWDCMVEGSKETQSFISSLKHIKAYSVETIEHNNTMVTEKAKAFWEAKQKLSREFMKQLEFDLCVGCNDVFDEVENKEEDKM